MIVQSIPLGGLLLGSIEAMNARYSDESFKSKISPQEWDLSARFKHPLRRREFLAGRALLHHLQTKIPPVLCAENGAPIWNDEYTGSLSHKEGWVIACVAPSKNYAGLGIDLEEPLKFPIDVAKVICVSEELKFLNDKNSREILTLIFSTKETLFKACYPLCQTWFGFQDAKVLSFDFQKGIFRIQLLRELAPFKHGQIFEGFFKEEIWNERRFVLTLLALKNER